MPSKSRIARTARYIKDNPSVVRQNVEAASVEQLKVVQEKIESIQASPGLRGETGKRGEKGERGPKGDIGPAGSPKRVEYYSGVTLANGTAKLTFSPAFTTPPAVESSITWQGSQMILGYASNITTTGCDILVMRSRGTLLLTAGPFEPVNSAGIQFRMQVIGG